MYMYYKINKAVQYWIIVEKLAIQYVHNYLLPKYTLPYKQGVFPQAGEHYSHGGYGNELLNCMSSPSHKIVTSIEKSILTIREKSNTTK